MSLQGEDRTALSPTGKLAPVLPCYFRTFLLLPTHCVFFFLANQSPSYPSTGGVASSRITSLRPESFLFRLSQKEEKRKGELWEGHHLHMLPLVTSVV